MERVRQQHAAELQQMLDAAANQHGASESMLKAQFDSLMKAEKDRHAKELQVCVGFLSCAGGSGTCVRC